ncbi:MAG: hypothetical protein R3279_09010 [Putridiphycobacter sp.]|nr:hypothetical protein [Putridiphycobacter sp.]
MKLSKIVLLFTILPVFGFAQEDLDDIFDDGDKDANLFIGTNLNTLGSGTLNLYADYYPAEKMRFQAGVGLMPLNTFRDYTFFLMAFDDDMTIKYEDVSGGTFCSLGFAVKSGLDMVIDFDYYYYGMFRYRTFGLNEDLFKVKQRKFSVGMGYLIGLPGRFNLDIMAGLAMGRAKLFDSNLIEPNLISEDRGVGFELTFGINYAL